MTDRHALFVGWVLGLAHRQGLALRPVLDAGGNYTDRLELELELVAGRAVRVVVVVPPPPPEWEPE